MNIFNRSETCATCGASVQKGVNFCPTCGGPMHSGTIRCGGCSRQIPADAKFCPHCGQDVRAAAAPRIDANRWRKNTDDFAARVEVNDLEGYFRRHLVIEPGTRAVMLVDGVNRGVLPPGKYALDDIKQKILYAVNLGTVKTITAILIDDGPCELTFEVPDLFTNDPLQIGFTCRVVFQLDPAGEAAFRFMNAMLKSRRSLSLTDIRGYLFPEIQDVAQTWLAQHSVKELAADFGLKAKLEQHLEMALNATFTRSGLKFESLRTLNFAHEQYDQLRDIHQKYYLALEKLEAEKGEAALGQKKLETRQLLFDVFNDEQLQDIFEEAKKVEHYEKRAAVWARMREAVMSDKMDELRREDDMEAFLRERDREKLISDKEWEELKRTFREEGEDHNRARAHLLAKIDMEQRYELRLKELTLQQDYSATEFTARQTEARRELELGQELEWRRWEHRIKLVEQEAEVKRRQQELDDLARRGREMADTRQTLDLARQKTQTAADIRAIEREEDRLDAEMGLALKRQMDADKLLRQEQELLLTLKKQERELDIQLQAEERRIKMQMEHERQQAELALAAKKAEQEFELARIDKLADLPAEALISLSGAPQAEMIASLKKTEALRGMDAEAILAMAADKSPQVAQAFAEKFKAMARGEVSQQERDLLERMLAQKDESAASMIKAMEESARRESETARHAMDTTADVAKAFAGAGGSQSPTVVYPPSGSAGAVVGGGPAAAYSPGGEVVVCPNCHTRSQTGTQFCANCGHKFFER